MTGPLLDPGNAQPDQLVGDHVDPNFVAELINLGRRVLAEPAPDSSAAERDLLPLLPFGAGETCSPAISAEMSEWVDLGGANSGCVGNQLHGTGFHRGANTIPATDYSRRRDPNGPDGPYVSWSWACAGDFSHGGNPALRNVHRLVLAQLMAGAFPMICEMITQPDPNKPVMYWARWEGVDNLREYTGSGHDLWSHLSWTRSKADQRPYLWRQAVAITEADAVKVFNTDNAIPNRSWRSDLPTNPKVAASTAIGYTWDDVHYLRQDAAAVKAALAAVQATLTAVLAAAKGDDDDAAIIATVKTEVANLKADFARQLAEQAANELARDTQHMTDLVGRVAALGQGGISAEMLLTALRQVYGQAFATAVQANAGALNGDVVTRALGQ